jgi:hypothetical protein
MREKSKKVFVSVSTRYLKLITKGYKLKLIGRIKTKKTEHNSKNNMPTKVCKKALINAVFG